MDKVTIRAKSEVKLTNGKINLTYTYPNGASIDGLTRDMIHSVVQNKGTQGARDWVNGLLDAYDQDYAGCE